MDKENDKYVWYVAYGSNLYEFRFIKYFDENYEVASANNNDAICKYCRYTKECIKNIMGGFNGWKKIKTK